VKKGGDQSLEDVAKSGCKPHMKYKSLIILLYLWLSTKKIINHDSIFLATH